MSYSDNTYYNLSFEFNKLYNEYYNLIEDTFNDHKNKINDLKNNNTLRNYLKNYFKNLQEKKIEYFKEIINEKLKSYNMELLNITINLGEYIESIMKKKYEEEDYKYNYYYIKIDEYSDNFINNISSIMLSLKNEVQSKLKEIYYRYNETLINESNKIPQININNSLDSIKILQDFEDEKKIIFNNIKNSIDSLIQTNYLDEKFMNGYFGRCYNLQNYSININELSFDFNEFKEEIGLQRNNGDNEYKEFLKNLLIESFNNSYYNFSNHFLKQQIVNNLNISINYKIEVLIDYIIEKIKKEYNYYTIN